MPTTGSAHSQTAISTFALVPSVRQQRNRDGEQEHAGHDQPADHPCRIELALRHICTSRERLRSGSNSCFSIRTVIVSSCLTMFWPG